MRPEDVQELYYLLPKSNLASVLTLGIMSHASARTLPHVSIADEEVQARRTRRQVMGRPLHDYANLYFCARNPMMYRRMQELGPNGMVVLAVDAEVMSTLGVVIADGNAAARGTEFSPYPGGLGAVDLGSVHGDWNESLELKRRKCAEVLVPHRVPRFYFTRLLTGSDTLAAELKQEVSRWPVDYAPKVFFR